MVDMYPTLAGLAGAPLGKHKPLDGLDVWPTISEGKPSPRHEVVYDIEPFRAALREGDWKLVWQATLPSHVELFDLAHDPGEQTDLAAANPEKVTALQQRIEALAAEAVPPLIFTEALGVLKPVLFGAVTLPDEQTAVEEQP
jgi:arylsulfatase B